MNWQAAVERTVTGLGYDLVDTERSARGLLRVFIDRVANDPAGEFITVDDCEKVTRQLQHVLEVEGCAYERLEVSSPGLDRPLKKPADYARFAGEAIELTLKLPFQGRKKYQGVPTAGPRSSPWPWALSRSLRRAAGPTCGRSWWRRPRSPIPIPTPCRPCPSPSCASAGAVRARCSMDWTTRWNDFLPIVIDGEVPA